MISLMMSTLVEIMDYVVRQHAVISTTVKHRSYSRVVIYGGGGGSICNRSGSCILKICYNDNNNDNNKIPASILRTDTVNDI